MIAVEQKCDRCEQNVTHLIMSRLNIDWLCEHCVKKEKSHPRYKEAYRKEQEEVKKGNFNYKGLLYGQELNL